MKSIIEKIFESVLDVNKFQLDILADFLGTELNNSGNKVILKVDNRFAPIFIKSRKEYKVISDIAVSSSTQIEKYTKSQLINLSFKAKSVSDGEEIKVRFQLTEPGKSTKGSSQDVDSICSSEWINTKVDGYSELIMFKGEDIED